MPMSPRTPCLHPGCPALVNRGDKGRCPEHRMASYKADRDHRGTPQERGYTAQYKKARAMHLRRNPLCFDCGRAATMVHHVRPIADGGDALAFDNMMSLCVADHAMRHAKVEG